MAKLYVTEFDELPSIANSPATVASTPALVDQTPVAIGGGSLQSAAFSTNTRIVRLHCDAVCSIAFGTNPTADANSARMAANQTEYFRVRAGQKVAVITNT